MTRYLVCVGDQDWARLAYARLPQRSGETWELVRRPNRNVYTLGEALVEDMEPRYLFFLHWSEKVRPEITEVYTCVNFHASRLPYGRGGHPIENLILRGHTETVITAHRMTEEIDAGPIYGRSGRVSLAGTKEEILDRFIDPCVELIRWIVQTEPTPVPQGGAVVPFQRLSPEAYDVFWKARA